MHSLLVGDVGAPHLAQRGSSTGLLARDLAAGSSSTSSASIIRNRLPGLDPSSLYMASLALSLSVGAS